MPTLVRRFLSAEAAGMAVGNFRARLVLSRRLRRLVERSPGASRAVSSVSPPAAGGAGAYDGRLLQSWWTD